MKVRTGIEVSGQSDIGCLRKNNEDSFGYWEPEDEAEFQRKGRMAVVADGMGGYEGGQEASRMAVDAMLKVYRESPSEPQQALIEGLQA
ncbi:MAG: protein phosphatase 2C domain-containing protein, partial [Terriglobales bacterium]